MPRRWEHKEWAGNAPIGMVKEFSESKIIGWVSVSDESKPPKITLHVNGVPVYETVPAISREYKSNTNVREFYIGMRQIWDFCKKTDRLTVRMNGNILPIAGEGIYMNPARDGERSLDELVVILARGHVLNRRGSLQKKKTLNKKWQADVLDFQAGVSAELKRAFNIETFIVYGTLLGSVREGGVIDHDTDIDLAYISKHEEGRRAAEEITEIAKHFAQTEEFDSRLTKVGLHVHDRANPNVRIDIFHLYFDERGLLKFPHGIAGHTEYKSSQWVGLEKTKFLDYTFNIPINPEPILEHIYGSNWRTPIVGFNWDHARTTQAVEAFTTEEERLAVKKLNARPEA